MNKLLNQHLDKLQDKFPKLIHRFSKKSEIALVSGELDICDDKGNYWDTFNIEIEIKSKKYPHTVPILTETSNKLPRVDSRHISADGVCCLEMDHLLLKKAQKGINILDFMSDNVYPFFVNQIFYDKKQNYANGEWDHHFDGIVQFYEQKLNVTGPKISYDLLSRILSNNLPTRNEACICGKGKYKQCYHKDAADFLRTLPKQRLEMDINGFKKILDEINPIESVAKK